MPSHDAGALGAEVQRTVGGGDGGGDEVAVVQVAGVAGLPAEEQLPAGGRGQQGGQLLGQLRGCGQRGPARGAGQQQVPGGQGLEPGQQGQGPRRAHDHVGDGAVLAHLPVDRQGQPQRLQPVEVGGVDQGQPRADRGEGGVGLRLVELGAGQLDLPGADVVGDHQRGDVPGQVGVGDGGADRQLPADDHAELDLVVQEADPGRADDVAGGAGDRVRGLAEERRRHPVRVHPGVVGVRAVVHHLRDDPRGGGHRAQQAQRLRRARVVGRGGEGGLNRGLQGRPVGQQLAGAGGGQVEPDHAGRRLHPPPSAVRARLTLMTTSP